VALCAEYGRAVETILVPHTFARISRFLERDGCLYRRRENVGSCAPQDMEYPPDSRHLGRAEVTIPRRRPPAAA